MLNHSKCLFWQRRVSPFFAILFCLSILFVNSLSAVPARKYYDEDSSAAFRELRDSIESIRHEVNNHETEIHMFEERVNNQEATLSSLRQQVIDANKVNKDLVKGTSTVLESKFANMEAVNKGLASDMAQLKTHANETATVLTQYKQKISDLERLIDLQNQNIDNLQAALRSLMDAVNSTSNSPSRSTPVANSPTGNIYKVKNGDNLEKIARINNTTVKAIKELNRLENDRIFVDQTLQMP